MGIPTYFRYLFQKDSSIVCSETPDCDYLFFDLNSILYKVFYDDVQNNSDENTFINNIIKEILYLCNDVVKPKKLIYFALDGTAPRAKMVQQRSRRYKSLQLQKLFGKKDDWSPSNHICPGTLFMSKFCNSLLHTIFQKKKFACDEIILNDYEVPGEGEHKILPIVRKLQKDDTDANVIIMSPDNDLISLSILTEKSKIYIMRFMDPPMASMMKKEFNKNDVMFIHLDKIMQKFLDTTSENIDKNNVLIDYNFLLSMVGNDFVVSVPYMKIKQGGMDKLIQLYHEIFDQLGTYLIDKKTLDINVDFFKKIIGELAKKESNEFLILGSFIQKEKSGNVFHGNTDDTISKEKQFENNVQHLYMCNSNHPLFSTYESHFKKVNFFSATYEWKSQYYSYFCENKRYNQVEIRNKMIVEYLKSLKFTLLYYNKECPSWNWYYPFRVAPLFSDIYYYICSENSDINSICKFSKGKPYSPFEQLMLILPPESKWIVPEPYHELFEQYKSYFPTEFEVDALQGLKYIYSEAILPEWDCFLQYMYDIRKRHKSLMYDDVQRNKISTKIYRFINK